MAPDRCCYVPNAKPSGAATSLSPDSGTAAISLFLDERHTRSLIASRRLPPSKERYDGSPLAAPSGWSRTATVLSANPTRSGSLNCLPYSPRAKQARPKPETVKHRSLSLIISAGKPSTLAAFLARRHDARCIPASQSWQSGLFLCWHARRILFPLPQKLAFFQKRGAMPAFKSDTVLPCRVRSAC